MLDVTRRVVLWGTGRASYPVLPGSSKANKYVFRRAISAFAQLTGSFFSRNLVQIGEIRQKTHL